MQQTLCHVILISLVLFPSLIPVILSIEKAIFDQEKHLMAADDQVGLIRVQTNLVKPEEYPLVVVAIFVETATPFMEEFWKKCVDLAYPKDNIHLFIYNKAAFHSMQIERFIAKQGKEYLSTKFINHKEKVNEHKARDMAIEYCEENNCDYYFHLESVVHVDNPNLLTMLIEENRPVLSPLLIRPYQKYSNFWNAISREGSHARSENGYFDVIKRERKGVWRVPFVTNAYLIRGNLIRNLETKPVFTYKNETFNNDEAFSTKMRENNVDLYLTNLDEWGHLIATNDFDASHLHSELYNFNHNRLDWEQRYLHSNYSRNLDPNVTVASPCTDAFLFPLVTTRFCDEMIETMEKFGQWSDGKGDDPRLEGIYESAPTKDIHLNQIGFEFIWLRFLYLYVKPLQERVYMRFVSKETDDVVLETNLNFVVRYRPEEQPYLKPHHDTSTYTINIALNRHAIDYEGGGCHFLRYNCSVIGQEKGWVLMHPGRLTHFHEGLATTKGTRYILVSFIDPY